MVRVRGMRSRLDRIKMPVPCRGASSLTSASAMDPSRSYNFDHPPSQLAMYPTHPQRPHHHSTSSLSAPSQGMRQHPYQDPSAPPSFYLQQQLQGGASIPLLADVPNVKTHTDFAQSRHPSWSLYATDFELSSLWSPGSHEPAIYGNVSPSSVGLQVCTCIHGCVIAIPHDIQPVAHEPRCRPSRFHTNSLRDSQRLSWCPLSFRTRIPQPAECRLKS